MMDRYENVHPKFRAWYDAQTDEVKAAIDAVSDASGGGNPDPRKARYMRLHKTLSFARDTYGYDFTP